MRLIENFGLNTHSDNSRGYKKCPKWRRSLVDLGRQGEGGYPKNLKFWETWFMDGPLSESQKIKGKVTILKNGFTSLFQVWLQQRRNLIVKKEQFML